MAKPGDRDWIDRLDVSETIPIGRVRKDLEFLKTLPTTFRSRPPKCGTGRHFDCYLQYGVERNKPCRVLTLGPLGRWLIAIDLLAADCSNDLEKVHVLVKADDPQRKGPKTAKRLFGGRPKDKILCSSARFRAYDRTSADPTDKSTAQFTNQVIDELNRRFERSRGRPIDIVEFLNVEVPIGGNGPLGIGPVKWLRNWIQLGFGPAFAVRGDLHAGDAGLGTLSTEWSGLLNILVQTQLQAAADPLSVEQDEGSHQHLVNVYGSKSLRELSSFARDAHVALERARQGDLNESLFAVHRVSLRAGTTRLGVLEQLYAILKIDPSPLQAIRKNSRTIDLNADLEPVRKVLTVSRIVILFESWEVVPGPLQVLYEYLSGTNWAELLSILGQPHFPTLRASDGNVCPTYQLIVVSSTKVDGLMPWCRHFQLDALWTPHQRHLPAAADARRIALDSMYDEARLTAAEVELAYQMKAERRGAWVKHVVQRPKDMPPRQGELQSMEHALERLDLTEPQSLSLCLIAASVTGMRRSTLRRCLVEWTALFRSTADPIPRAHAKRQPTQSPADEHRIDEEIRTLLAKLDDILIEVEDEEVEALSAPQRGYELDREPRLAPELNEQRPRVIFFGSALVRSLFVRVWKSTEAMPSGSPKILARLYPQCTWARANFILAEESIRQATSQFRHVPADSPTSAYFLCRTVQGLFHALASLGVSTDAFKAGKLIAGGLYGPALPVDSAKRLRYLHRFQYLKVAESDEHRLGRSFGRSDLRLDLQALFVRPELTIEVLAPSMMTAVEMWGSLKEVHLAQGRSGEAPSAGVAGESSAAWFSLLEAIGRAGCDLGGPSGEAAVTWALDRLPHEEASIQVRRSFPQDPAARIAVINAAMKLRIDWYQSRGSQDRLADAESLCRGGLSELNIDVEKLVADLFETAGTALTMARRDQPDVRSNMQARFHAVQEEVERATADIDARLLASELLFRLAEVFATRADKLEPAQEPAGPMTGSPGPDPALEFARALAVYWIADRLRSSVCLIDGEELEWPTASARSMRYYVRVILKLASLVGREQRVEGDVLSRMSTQLLEQGQNRIGVYTRHNFRFRRERESMLSLEAGRLRVWARMLLARSLIRRGATGTHLKGIESGGAAAGSEMTAEEESLQLCDQLMDQCWQLLDQAEQLLISLGFRSAHVRRLLVERVKAATAVIAIAAARLPSAGPVQSADIRRRVFAYQRHARASLDALSAACQGQDFWRHIVERQEARLIEAGSSWNRVTSTLQ